MNDTTGTRFSFTVTAGLPETISLTIEQESSVLDVDNATWTAFATDANGNRTDIIVEHGALTGQLLLHIPALTAHELDWELFSTSSEGETDRLLYGRITPLTSKHAKDLVDDSRNAVLRSLTARIAGNIAAPLALKWNASSVAANYAEEARKEYEKLPDITQLIETANATLQTAQTALGKLTTLDDLLAKFYAEFRKQVSIDEATNCWVIGGILTATPATGEPGKSPKLSTAYCWLVYNNETKQWEDTGISAVGQDGKSPYISALGTWVEYRDGAWVDTGIPAQGKDGLNGTVTRRILVNQAEDIPTSGDTCNGGVFYYLRNDDTLPQAVITPLEEGRESTDTLTIDGNLIPLEEGIASMTPADAATSLATCINAAGVVGITASAQGTSCTIHSEGETLTVNRSGIGYHVLEIPREKKEGHLVFAWLEQPDGTSGWVCTGLANDIATADVYGLTKLATDLVIEKGAPVGNNASGQLTVPLADFATPGSVLPALDEHLELHEGGAVTTTRFSGKMVAQPANNTRWGVMKHSTGREGEVDCVGIMPDGSTGITWADLTRGGVVKPGSEMKQLNAIPYQIGVGMNSDHTLCNNYLNQGAIKHMRPTAWIQAMDWVGTLPAGTFESTSYYTGLHTSTQFSQSEENGLVLNSATGTLLAGVYIATSRGDSRPDAVLTASQTATWYYNKEQVYTKTETETWVQNYTFSKQYINSTFLSKTDAGATYLTQANARSTYVAKTSNWEGDLYLSEDEFAKALAKGLNPKIAYHVLKNKK